MMHGYYIKVTKPTGFISFINGLNEDGMHSYFNMYRELYSEDCIETGYIRPRWSGEVKGVEEHVQEGKDEPIRS